MYTPSGFDSRSNKDVGDMILTKGMPSEKVVKRILVARNSISVR